jgi:hypothetical protein
MKALMAVLTMCIVLTAVPAMAQTLYDNGPINGNTSAWTINFGYAVSDSFNVPYSPYGSTITGASFGMWLFPGDTLTSAELSITSLPFGGTQYFDETVNFTQGPCTSNQYGYNVCVENTTFYGGPILSQGTYWLSLQNARVPSGDPVYWDENFGPSRAKDSSVLPMAVMGSESFTVLGTGYWTTSTCMCGCSAQANCADSPSSTAPEPGSIWLFGPGCLALFSSLRGLRRRLL